LLDGLRAIAVDLRGHGLSEHRESYGYADYERDVLAMIDELGDAPVVLAGHSLGGYVALRAATANDRIRAVLAADVKSDWTEADAAFAERARHASQRVEPDREPLVERLALPLQPARLEHDELEAIAARSVEPVDGGWRYRWDRRVLAPEPVEPFTFLPQVRCAACVIAGSESDVMPPESAERFAGAIPGAELEIVDGAGHHVELEAPERVAARIRGLVALTL
jgi:pimeloyl-ACP methyl ester carboxylesterase